VLCAGDLSDAREFDDYEGKLSEVLDVFEKQELMTKTVPGNMDPEEACVKKLIQRRMNIHKKIASFEEFDTVGFGGGQTPFDTPFEPEGEEIRTALETLFDRMKSDTKIGVIHQPPAATNLDIVEGDHVGSTEVRELIEEKDFDLVLTGHIHESRGIDRIEGTEVINPGPVLEGYYGIAEIKEEIELDMKQL
ncbi:MAG: metallophosphoesterase family protein, partial [Candidatus Nanohaloarchaea archaeon]|nr:metallophosphoesterase family protein [Candidatus Nanohaloarchaea archaeon]